MAGILSVPEIKETHPRYALSPRNSFVSPAALVGRIDHFGSRDRRERNGKIEDPYHQFAPKAIAR